MVVPAGDKGVWSPMLLKESGTVNAVHRVKVSYPKHSATHHSAGIDAIKTHVSVAVGLLLDSVVEVATATDLLNLDRSITLIAYQQSLIGDHQDQSSAGSGEQLILWIGNQGNDKTITYYRLEHGAKSIIGGYEHCPLVTPPPPPPPTHTHTHFLFYGCSSMFSYHVDYLRGLLWIAPVSGRWSYRVPFPGERTMLPS